jgi:hypothetical protein|tara:strand:+ start:133 stop:471 length:339 start_codon:yes stop_codon:yes gene_type:complete
LYFSSLKFILEKSLLILFSLFTISAFAQTDSKIDDIINVVSAERIKANVKTLTEFSARNTFSDTIYNTQSIGVTRRWIKSEFEVISKACDTCMEVFYQKYFVTKRRKLKRTA